MEKKIWWLVVIGGVVVVLYILGRIAMSPSVGKINTNISLLPTPTGMEYIRYDGQNISFAYENKYELRGQEGSWQLVGRAGVNSLVVITLKKFSSGDLEDVSGVKMRRLKPTEYEEVPISESGLTGVEFKLITGGEWVDFFIADGYALTMAYTNNSMDVDMSEKEFRKLVESIRLINI